MKLKEVKYKDGLATYKVASFWREGEEVFLQLCDFDGREHIALAGEVETPRGKPLNLEDIPEDTYVPIAFKDDEWLQEFKKYLQEFISENFEHISDFDFGVCLNIDNLIDKNLYGVTSYRLITNYAKEKGLDETYPVEQNNIRHLEEQPVWDFRYPRGSLRYAFMKDLLHWILAKEKEYKCK